MRRTPDDAPRPNLQSGDAMSGAAPPRLNRGPDRWTAWHARAAPAARTGNPGMPWSGGRLDWIALAQLLFSLVPAMIAVRAGQPTLAARWLFGTITIFVIADVFFRAPPADLVLVIGAMPALSLLRDLFFYNAILVLMAIPLANLVLRSPNDLRRLRSAGMRVFAFLSFFYWLVSFALSADYSRNLRIGEMVLGAAAILVLAPRRQMLATSMLGVLITLIAIGLAFLGLSDRLSYAVVDGVLLGNPVAYGVPLAMVLALCVADNGRWIMLQRKPGVRLTVCVIAGILLLLSTSRASWLAAAVDVLLVVILSGGQRKFVLTSLAVLVIATVAVMQTSGGASLQGWFHRTFSPDRSLLQKTDGRSDQWILFPVVMAHAPPWGFGPGRGREIYAKYSLLDDKVRFQRGNDMAWHSLYLQIGIELGALGLAALVILLGRTAWIAYRHWTLTSELMPLLGVMSFLIVAGTVSGMDPFAGMFLGFGLVASSSKAGAHRKRSREGRRSVDAVTDSQVPVAR